MTELEVFLTALYDSLAEAEVQALEHGHRRLAEALKRGTVPEDASLPVYHATNFEVDVDVGLRVRVEDGETKLVVTEKADDETPSGLHFDVEVFDFLDLNDLEQSRYVDDSTRRIDVGTHHRIPFTRPSVRGTEPERAGAGSEPTAPTDLTVLTGIGDVKADALRDAGYQTLDDVGHASVEKLTTVEGIWAELAEHIVEEARVIERKRRSVDELTRDDGPATDRSSETTCDDDESHP